MEMTINRMFPNMGGFPLLQALASAQVQDADSEKHNRANREDEVTHDWLLNLNSKTSGIPLRKG
jgi:hypothetical protein